MPAATAPQVAIVILNWNGKADLLNCVSTLPRLRYPNWDATVIDNASKDGSVEAVRAAYPAQRVVVMEQNLGFCGGNNRGMRDALARGADYVLLLNNDTEMHPDLVVRAGACGADDPCIGAVGAKNFAWTTPRRLWGAYGDSRYGRHLVRVVGAQPAGAAAYGGVQDVDWVIGNGIMMSRQAHRGRRRISTSRSSAITRTSTGASLPARAGFASSTTVRAIIYHKGSAASESDREVPFPTVYFLTRNTVLFVWKHGSAWQRVGFCALMLVEIPRLLALGVVRPRRMKIYLSVLRGFIDGLAGRLPLRALKLR